MSGDGFDASCRSWGLPKGISFRYPSRVRVTPTSPARLTGEPLLRLTWERPVSAWRPLALEVVREVAGRNPLRVALPLDLDETTADQALLPPLVAELQRLRVGVDVVPRMGAVRGVNTTTAALFHERLLPALATLPSTVGVFVYCEPVPSTLRAALSVGGGGALVDRARGLSGLVGGVASSIWSARQGRRDLVELARDLRSRPSSSLAAVPPPLMPLDAPLSAAAVHWLLGCPDGDGDGDGSLFLGPAAALCCAPLVTTDRQGQHRALALWAARHREKSHAICVGPIAPLAGMAPTAVYQASAHLRQDLLAVQALGFSDITVMSLDGLIMGADDVERPDVDDWVGAISGGTGPLGGGEA